MKNPNGYGSITKLSGKRRKPWRVRKTDGWDIDEKAGTAKQRFINIGCYATRQEAMQALADFNAHPYSIKDNITFAEVYQRWFESRFKPGNEKKDRSSINGYNAAFKTCEKIHDIKFRDLKLSHLQKIVDDSGKNHSSLKKLKTLYSQLFEYAVKYEIIGSDKDISNYVEIGEATKSTLHYRFTSAEIDVMWRWAQKNEYVQVILMLIYTGVRPGELFDLKTERVDLKEKSFFIDQGKNSNAVRKVPIHDRIYPFFVHWAEKKTEYLITQHNGKKFNFATNHGQYKECYWDPILKDMGISKYKNEKGEEQEHLPDDTRHTFTTMWKEKKLDEAMRRKIQGHSGKGIGEIVYTHFEFEKLREELNQI